MERRKLLSRIFEPHPASPGVARYTNAVLLTQNNTEVRFYDDLIRGRQAVVNFMYAECKGACSLTTQRMKRIYGELKNRMGVTPIALRRVPTPGHRPPLLMTRFHHE